MDKDMLNIALAYVSAQEEKANRLAYAIYGMIEGGDPEEAAQLLAEYGYTDENGEWIFEDE